MDSERQASALRNNANLRETLEEIRRMDDSRLLEVLDSLVYLSKETDWKNDNVVLLLAEILG